MMASCCPSPHTSDRVPCRRAPSCLCVPDQRRFGREGVRCVPADALLLRRADVKMPRLFEMTSMVRSALIVVSLLCLVPGCLTLADKPITSSGCSFDQVWDTAIAALEGGRLESVDKPKGVVESAWMEVESSSKAGVMQRDVNKERVKYIIDVKGDSHGTTAVVSQLREEWTPMGVRMRQWRSIPGNPAEESALAGEISRRLKEKGC